MTCRIFNEAKRAIMEGEIDFVDTPLTVKVLMTDTTVLDDAQADITTVTDFTDLDEFDTVLYSEQSLENQTVTRIDAIDRAVFTADPVLWVPAGTGSRDAYLVLIYEPVSGIPILATDAGLAQDGLNISYAPPNGGILQI